MPRDGQSAQLPVFFGSGPAWHQHDPVVRQPPGLPAAGEAVREATGKDSCAKRLRAFGNFTKAEADMAIYLPMEAPIP